MECFKWSLKKPVGKAPLYKLPRGQTDCQRKRLEFKPRGPSQGVLDKPKGSNEHIYTTASLYRRVFTHMDKERNTEASLHFNPTTYHIIYN